jgi:hypothetical protein
VAIQDKIPKTLSLEEQSYFTLGYYQMSALINAEKREYIEAKKNNTKCVEVD